MHGAGSVKDRVGRYLLADGKDIVIDLRASKGSWLVDKATGDRYLDCFSMFASMAVGYNHDTLLAAREELGRIAINKPANSDIYSEEMAEFVETFASCAMPPALPHLFCIEGGAMAVENGLKTAFDWKVRKNFAKGCSEPKGSKIIHFRQAFHGRSGYTLSLTNSADPRKTRYFPVFDWPRIINPKITFPLNSENLARVQDLERQALAQILAAIDREGESIAGLIIEPIQGEGGDNHFRSEFFRDLRRLCDEHEMLLILDEVQTGVGLTGKFWAHEHFGFTPDILCFGKKTQVCGMLASRRIDEVSNNVFRESSRINSTFGGNLVDMARFSLILKIIEEERLVANAAVRGRELLLGLQRLEEEFAPLVTNARGLGLMCAFDLPDTAGRDEVLAGLLQERLLILGCGERSIRFRPHLIISAEEIAQALAIVRKVLGRLRP